MTKTCFRPGEYLLLMTLRELNLSPKELLDHLQCEYEREAYSESNSAEVRAKSLAKHKTALAAYEVLSRTEPTRQASDVQAVAGA